MDDTSGEGQAGHQCGLEELKEYVTSNFTSRGVAIQSSGKKCFKLTLPQEMLNVEEFVEGITARGGAVDIMLETDAMRATVWDAGGPARYKKLIVGTSSRIPMILVILAVVCMAAAGWLYASSLVPK